MAELDEPIEIMQGRSNWPAIFDAEAAAIRTALGGVALGVEHIGSTAVDGLAAKPIIDIQVGVAGKPEATAVENALTKLEYEAMGEAGVPGRLYFRKRQFDFYNVHVVEFEGHHWIANLAIRDYLRAHSAEADKYAAYKRQAARSATGLLDYSARKAAFVEELLRQALNWRQGC
jgi:GrpB-like predicted nucleotidyltransferase (UPF0157 family)